MSEEEFGNIAEDAQVELELSSKELQGSGILGVLGMLAGTLDRIYGPSEEEKTKEKINQILQLFVSAGVSGVIAMRLLREMRNKAIHEKMESAMKEAMELEGEMQVFQDEELADRIAEAVRSATHAAFQKHLEEGRSIKVIEEGKLKIIHPDGREEILGDHEWTETEQKKYKLD